jgi:integrase/recombinase XerD
MGQATVLTDAEHKRVLKAIAVNSHAERNRAAFLLSSLAGMRVGEISHLTVGDVMNADGSIVREIKLTKHQTKGNRARTVFLSEKLRRELASYVKSLPRTDADFPFIYSQRGYRHFSNVSLCITFSNFFKWAGMRNSSHSGRRGFATKLNAKGVGMRTIQVAMGHSNISTTALYCDVSEEQLRNAVALV